MKTIELVELCQGQDFIEKKYHTNLLETLLFLL